MTIPQIVLDLVDGQTPEDLIQGILTTSITTDNAPPGPQVIFAEARTKDIILDSLRQHCEESKSDHVLLGYVSQDDTPHEWALKTAFACFLLGAERVFFCSDAWMIKVKDPDVSVAEAADSMPPPSEHPDRVECWTVMSLDRAKKSRIMSIEYEGRKVTHESPWSEAGDSVGGRIIDLLQEALERADAARGAYQAMKAGEGHALREKT